MRIGGRLDDNLIERITDIIKERWFWGDIPREAAERSLDNKTFLIRLSHRGNIRVMPFSLSIVFTFQSSYTSENQIEVQAFPSSIPRRKISLKISPSKNS